MHKNEKQNNHKTKSTKNFIECTPKKCSNGTTNRKHKSWDEKLRIKPKT